MRSFWRRLLKRDRPETGPVTLDRRRVYIIPSRSGFIFSIILLAMLIGSINYQNNLAFMLTFLLTSLAIVSMIHAVRNLYGLRLSAGHPQAVFAGDNALFPVSLDNTVGYRNRRLALKLMLPNQEPITLDLPQGGGQWIHLPLPARHRGYLQSGCITLYSRFPLGLFHTWSYVHLSMQTMVYPRPDRSVSLPPQTLQQSNALGDKGHGNDDFATFRPYHPGDSLRHLHWKAFAREQGLMTKQFGADINEEVWLHWDQLTNLSIEKRLSRLTHWVLEADSIDANYGLVLPDQVISLGRGKEHRRHCLEALALFALPGESHAQG